MTEKKKKLKGLIENKLKLEDVICYLIFSETSIFFFFWCKSLGGTLTSLYVFLIFVVLKEKI